MNRAFLGDSELMEAYELYTICVNRQVHTIETDTKRAIRSYPTGLNHLPYAGSVMDQPHRLMEYFDVFLHAERNEFHRKL